MDILLDTIGDCMPRGAFSPRPRLRNFATATARTRRRGIAREILPRMGEVDARDQLRRLIGAYRISQALHVMASLGLADRLAERTHTSAELAEAAGAHADSLHRLLRALATVGIVEEDSG